MTERIDHAAEARDYLQESRTNVTHLDHERLVTDAQVSATLALVEQQAKVAEQLRTQNLIALFTARPDSGISAAIDDFADEAYNHLAGRQIREALGL